MRVRWLVQWIKTNLLSGQNWNDRRLIIFTEWEDTRRWLERRLKEVLSETDRADERIAVFTGATGFDSPHDAVQENGTADAVTTRRVTPPRVRSKN